MNEKLGTIHELRIDEGLGQNYAMDPVYEKLPRHLTFHVVKCIFVMIDGVYFSGYFYLILIRNYIFNLSII